MAGVVAVMSDGRIVQSGDPRDVYARPSSRFVAEFIGGSNLIDAVVQERRNGTCVVRTPAGLLAAADGADIPVGTRVVLVVRAERLRLEPAASSPAALNRWPGVVRTPVFRGDSVDHEVAVGDLRLRVRTEPALAAASGDQVTVMVPADSCVLFPAERR